jgi:hypothetical protein
MDEIYRELKEANVEDIDYHCTMVFDETANAEEIVGYYLADAKAKQWFENIEGRDLTEQDREVTRIFTELGYN